MPVARRLAPVLIAAAGAVAYLVLQPASEDLAAHTFRATLFARDGFAVWDGLWYGGHHLPAYSVLFPPLAAALGPRLAGALAAVAAAALFAALARGRWGERAWLGAAWFGLGAVTLLLTGRLAFAFGVALALGALLALQRGRRVLAITLAIGCALGSPVAAAFLALAAVSLRSRAGAGLAVAALAPLGTLTLLFPEGGTEPFVVSAFWPCAAVGAAALAALPRQERALRTGALLYAVAALAAFVLPTPMGGNAARLGALFAGPLAAAALWPARRRALAALALPLLFWQWTSPVQDLATAADDPSVQASYYAPLLGYLKARPPGRLEIPFTRAHWEAARVAPSVPLARGWERQLDRRVDPLFYGGRLTPARYGRWLRASAVRWVALPDVPLDASARAEAALVRGGLPYLRPVFRSAHWRVWAVRHAAPLASPPARVLAAGAQSVRLALPRPATVTVRVRWTPYWLARGACVAPAPGGWTRLSARRAGRVRLVIAFDLDRAGSRSARCG